MLIGQVNSVEENMYGKINKDELLILDDMRFCFSCFGSKK